jgi:TolB-like protein/Tfp pilus assembly protein PilF
VSAVTPRRSGRKRLRFGDFELDVEAPELRLKGAAVRLQPQPLRILALLASSAARVVSREEIRSAIWGEGTYVDFDQGLNFSIRRIRAALGDDSESPHYIETLPRRGYRFIATVEELSPAVPLWPSGKMMLAVLPFVNLTGDPDQEYFSDGLTEEMITELGRLHPEQLGVISRTSAMRYKHAESGVDQIGRELKVDYVLEGSVRSASNRVRITVQLIQVADQTHSWAESYDRELRDILALQSDVARAVAATIRLRLTSQEQSRLENAHPVDPEIFQLYLRGRYWWNKGTEQNLRKSITCFQQAIEGDPDSALAYSGLADSYLRLLDKHHLPPKDATALAKEAAERALALDGTLAEVHTSLGHVQLHELDCRAAEERFRRAIEVNPSYATAYFYYANCLLALGREEEAIAAARRSLALDPVSPAAEINLATMLYYGGEWAQAIEHSERALELEPNWADAYETMGKVYVERHLHRDAIAALRKAVSLSERTPRHLADLGHAYAAAGKKREAMRILEELTSFANEKRFGAYDVALVHCALGDRAQALQWLSKAYEERSGRMPFLGVDPRMKPLSSEAGFRDLTARISL